MFRHSILPSLVSPKRCHHGEQGRKEQALLPQSFFGFAALSAHLSVGRRDQSIPSCPFFLLPQPGTLVVCSNGAKPSRGSCYSLTWLDTPLTSLLATDTLRKTRDNHSKGKGWNREIKPVPSSEECFWGRT